MGIISTFLNKDKEKGFKGHGYTEEGALYHAEQRTLAWVREEKIQSNDIIVLSREIDYEKKGDLLVICYIRVKYSLKKIKPGFK